METATYDLTNFEDMKMNHWFDQADAIFDLMKRQIEEEKAIKIERQSINSAPELIRVIRTFEELKEFRAVFGLGSFV